MYLHKLAKAIRDANTFVHKATSNESKPLARNYKSTVDTSPTAKEKTLSERPISFGDKLEIREEPSTEFLR